MFVPHWEEEVESSPRHRLLTTNTRSYADIAISLSLLAVQKIVVN